MRRRRPYSTASGGFGRHVATGNSLNRFRRILVRWEKPGETYIAMLHLALGVITWRATGLLE